jgi:alpha-L-fucosidase
MVGYPGKLNWEQTAEGLKIQTPAVKPNDIAVVYKIEGAIV